jgi:uncharacterized protein YycO
MRYRNRDSGVEVDVADDKVMDGGVWEPVGSQTSSDGPPPKAGKGSSRDVWAAYAADRGVDVDDDMSRDDIIEAVEEG